MRMKVQATHGTNARTHKTLVEFYRIEVLARGIVDTDAVIRGAAETKTSLFLLRQTIKDHNGRSDIIYEITVNNLQCGDVRILV